MLRVSAPFLIALLFLFPPPLHAGRDRKAEKERQKAWEEAQSTFLIAYKSADAQIRRGAVLKLREFADLGAARLVVERVFPTERSAGVLEAAIRVVAASSDPAVVEWLVTKAQGRGDWIIRSAVVEALGAVKGERVDLALAALLDREKDPRVLSMALFAVGEKRLTDLYLPVLRHLEHEDWQVRVAAIETLGEWKDKRAVEPLIDRLMNETGRLREDIAEALKSITGKDFGADPNKWRKWLNEGDAAGEDDPEPKKEGVASGVKDEPTYFGIKVNSERVLFVIDVSLSMRTPIDIDKMKVAREAALTGDGGEDGNREEKFEDTIKWWKIKDRLDLAKAQLMFVIKNLQSKQQFEIVSFSEKIESWNGGRLMKANARNKTKALRFVDPLDVEGATAAGAALDFAFEMAGAGAHDKNYKTGVDTIFFLSDGAPSDRNTDEILEEVRGRNRLRKIKIHVVAIVNQSVRFLRLLAEQNGGVYKFFKVEDKK